MSAATSWSILEFTYRVIMTLILKKCKIMDELGESIFFVLRLKHDNYY